MIPQLGIRRMLAGFPFLITASYRTSFEVSVGIADFASSL